MGIREKCGNRGGIAGSFWQNLLYPIQRIEFVILPAIMLALLGSQNVDTKSQNPDQSQIYLRRVERAAW
jgi:hypothetical protein